MSAIEQFRGAISAAGLTPPEAIEPDGKLHRFASNGKRGDDAGWYILHGDGIPAGAFGDWRAGMSQPWRADIGRRLSPQEEATHRARIAAIRREREADDSKRRARAREKAAETWKAAAPAPDDHPYLTRKGVRAHRLRVHGEALVVPMRANGDLHSLQLISADGDKRFLSGGRVTGCYFSIGKPDGVLCIAEGYATAASIYEATGHAVAVAFNAGNLLPVAKALREKFPAVRLIVAADNDIGTTGNPGLTKAREAAQGTGAHIAVPELDGRSCDFNDVTLARGAGAVKAAIDAAAQAPASEGFVSFAGAVPHSAENSQWSDPKPLDDALPSVPQFARELLPDALRGWVTDVAERTQAPIEYVAVSAMVSLGAALGRKLAVRPKRLDDWCEFANLWGAVVGPPSWMKSPALDEGKRPLTLIEARMLEGFDLTHREWEADSEAAKVTRDGAKDRARKAARDGRRFDKMELVAEPIPEEPMPPRLIANDATVPALCDVLRANPNGVLVFRDELAGLVAELDREGMEGSRGFYLSGWSGKEGHTQDRILRGTNLRVPYVCLSVLGGIQPARVAPLLRDSIATGGGDGFLARFSLTVWPDSPGEYRSIDRDPDENARRLAWVVYERLHALNPQNVGAEIVDGAAPFLRLDPEGAEAFTAWDVSLRNRLRSDVEDAALGAHLGKYPKAVAAIALLSHLADGGEGPISLDAVLRALAWSELLESHARRLYASLGQAHVEAAKSLLKRVRRGDLAPRFTLREVYRRGWAHLPDREAAHAAVDVLEVKGWLRACAIDPGNAGGRPSIEYVIHPSVMS